MYMDRQNLPESLQCLRRWISTSSYVSHGYSERTVRTLSRQCSMWQRLTIHLTLVNDQIGTPTYTFDLARLLVDMIETDKYGYYHATNEGGYISWYDFTKEIFRQAVELGHDRIRRRKQVTVLPVTTAEYGVSKAARPFNSRLDKSKLVENGFTPLPTWQDALGRYLKEIEF